MRFFFKAFFYLLYMDFTIEQLIELADFYAYKYALLRKEYLKHMHKQFVDLLEQEYKKQIFSFSKKSV